MKKRLAAVTMFAAIAVIFTFTNVNSQQTAENKEVSQPQSENNVVWAIEPQFQLAGSFHEGLAKVKKRHSSESTGDLLFGYIDKSGKYVIGPQFQEAGDFSEGYALVQKEYSMAFIDKTGKTVIKDLYKYKDINGFHEGLALVSIEKTIGYDKFKTYMFINKKGSVAIKSNFRSATSFYEGLSLVGVAESGGRNTKYGYINKTGAFVLKPQYINARCFSDGLARVKIKDNDQWMYIDKTGKIVLQPKVFSPDDFYEGFAQLGQSACYIDKTGTKVINTNMSWGKNFSEGLAAVAQRDSSGKYKWGYINTQGAVVIDLQFDDVRDFSDGLAAVEKDGTWGFIKNPLASGK